MAASNTHSKAVGLLRALLLLAGLSMTLIYLYCAVQRLIFPHEIKWMEGGVLDQVLQILAGRDLYTEPDWNFATYLYTPFYYYLSAAVSLITGPTFMSIRLVSLASSVAAAGLLMVIVQRETDSRFAGIISGLFFLSAYKASGFFMDAGRIDSLFLALVLGYACAARYLQSYPGQLLAALLGALALMTKQTAVIACVPIAIYLLAIQPARLKWVVPLTGTALAAGAMLYFYIASDGWFAYYVFELPQAHRYQWFKFPTLIGNEFLLRYPFVIAAGVGALLLTTGAQRRRAAFALLLVITLLLAAVLPYMHTGSAANVLLPMQAACALLLGIALALAEKIRRIYAAILTVTVVQFALLGYSPASVIPTAAQAQRAQQFVHCIATLPGPVLNTRSGYLWSLAGKQRSAHEPAIADIFRAGDSPEKLALQQEFLLHVQNQYYSALFLGPQLTHELESMLGEYYVDTGFNLNNDTGNSAVNGYLLSKAFVARNYIDGRTLSGNPICGQGKFFE